jgi:hypothetical protein
MSYFTILDTFFQHMKMTHYCVNCRTMKRKIAVVAVSKLRCMPMLHQKIECISQHIGASAAKPLATIVFSIVARGLAAEAPILGL